MTSVVPSIVEVLMNKIALWISNCGNNWTAESAPIASNGRYELKFFSSCADVKGGDKKQ